jgi:hypothetical protein
MNLHIVKEQGIEVLSFDNVNVESMPNDFIFIKSSLALIIQCVVLGLQPNIFQIRTADLNFVFVLQHHGKLVDPNDPVRLQNVGYSCKKI